MNFNYNLVGYGLDNPYIKTGMRGWFASNPEHLKKILKEGKKDSDHYGKLIEIKTGCGWYYKNEKDIDWSFFYPDESPYIKHRPYAPEELFKILLQQGKPISIIGKCEAIDAPKRTDYRIVGIGFFEKNTNPLVKIQYNNVSYLDISLETLFKEFVNLDGSLLGIEL